MIKVGVRELKERTSYILRLVSDQGQEVRITRRGRVVARLLPVDATPEDEDWSRAWSDLDELAAEISSHWPAGVTAAEAVSAERREL